MNPTQTSLFSPVRIGALQLKNRVVMAPLTRTRATPGTDAPNALMAEYYAQRAGAGLIISEATQILQQGKGYHGAPGIYSAEQEAGWRRIAEAVHAKGGLIVAQIWHVGAISHPDYQPGGALPVSASAFNPGGTTHTQNGKQPRVTCRALERDEIPGIVAAYKHAAETAQRAGLDGIEVHAANGYLLEQFMRDSSNKRSDDYGGSIDNRIRLTLEVVDACVAVWGKDRVGIRLSPLTNANNAQLDSNTQATYGALVEALGQRGIAYVHFVEGQTRDGRDLDGFDFAAARQTLAAQGVAYIANNRYDRQMALDAIASGHADAIAFGRYFISNPDLPTRLERNAPLAALVDATIYASGAEGYTDYPALAEA